LLGQITVAALLLEQLREVWLAVQIAIKSSIGGRCQETPSMCAPEA